MSHPSLTKTHSLSKILKLLALCLIAGSAIGGGVALSFEIQAFVNFEMGFWGFVFVIGSSFIGVIQKLKAHHTQSSNSPKVSQDATENAKNSKPKPHTQNFSARLVLGTQLSFSLLRIVGYGVFVGVMACLMHYGLLHLLWFLAGLQVALVLLFAFGVFMLRYVKTKE